VWGAWFGCDALVGPWLVGLGDESR
jgi:hypothetical protein